MNKQIAVFINGGFAGEVVSSRATWPVSRLVRAGYSAYSCLVRQTDGMVEWADQAGRRRRFDCDRLSLAWLGHGPVGH